MGRKHCGKRRNCSLRAISPFPAVFSKDLYSRRVKSRACLGKGEMENSFYFLEKFEFDIEAYSAMAQSKCLDTKTNL